MKRFVPIIVIGLAALLLIAASYQYRFDGNTRIQALTCPVITADTVKAELVGYWNGLDTSAFAKTGSGGAVDSARVAWFAHKLRAAADSAKLLQTLDTTAIKSRSLAAAGRAADSARILEGLDTTAIKSRSLAAAGRAADSTRSIGAGGATFYKVWIHVDTIDFFTATETLKIKATTLQ